MKTLQARTSAKSIRRVSKFFRASSNNRDERKPCQVLSAGGRQVVVDDVESSPVFDEPDRAVVLNAGVRSVVSTPLLDMQGNVWGVLSAHCARAHRMPDHSVTSRVQQQADDCARRLCW